MPLLQGTFGSQGCGLRAPRILRTMEPKRKYLSKWTFGGHASSQLLDRAAAECQMVVLKSWKAQKLSK